MKVTKDGFKDRQLHIEDYLQMVSAEQKEYAEVSAHQRIAENNDIITDFQTGNLMEQILHNDNLNKAYKKVKSNKGAGGVDGMSVDELLGFLKDNQEQLIQQIKEGKYKPNQVRRVEIPKETKGEVRKLGVPTVVDRVFQQAITQVLSPIYEKQFSENSFGFRPNRGAHDALKQCQTNVNAGVISRGMFEKTEIGMPQGGPLSPLLSNIMLNELDKELTRRGHRFVRYADDCMIFCKSRKRAERTLNNIVPYIEEKLFLKVNRTKTCVAHISKVKYLGYRFYRHKGTCRFRVHPKSIIKMKNRIRELTDRHNGWGNEYRALKLTQFIRGWVNYFGMADMKSLLQSNDKWLRHRIRAVYWKQWKKTKTKYRKLKELGMNEDFIQWHANMRQGIWNCSNNRLVQFALNNEKLREWGYPTFTEFYLKRCEN